VQSSSHETADPPPLTNPPITCSTWPTTTQYPTGIPPPRPAALPSTRPPRATSPVTPSSN
jgi:hypothetical protein